MGESMDMDAIDRIDEIIRNPLLANSIHESVITALKHQSHVKFYGNSVWEVFKRSRELAIYNLTKHERAPLFLRLIQHGPLNPDDPPELAVKENPAVLSDTESGSCVQFIYYFMVDRFKGELGELLALKPVIELVQSLQRTKRLPNDL